MVHAIARGKRLWSTGVLREIVQIELQVTVTFEDLEGKTRMTLTHVGFPDAGMEKLAGQGWNESFDKLAASLND